MSVIRQVRLSLTSVSSTGTETGIGFANETGIIRGVYITNQGSATQMEDIQIRAISGSADRTDLYFGSGVAGGAAADALPFSDVRVSPFDNRTTGTEMYLYLKPDVTSDLDVTILVEVF